MCFRQGFICFVSLSLFDLLDASVVKHLDSQGGPGRLKTTPVSESRQYRIFVNLHTHRIVYLIGIQTFIISPDLLMCLLIITTVISWGVPFFGDLRAFPESWSFLFCLSYFAFRVVVRRVFVLFERYIRISLNECSFTRMFKIIKFLINFFQSC